MVKSWVKSGTEGERGSEGSAKWTAAAVVWVRKAEGDIQNLGVRIYTVVEHDAGFAPLLSEGGECWCD